MTLMVARQQGMALMVALIILLMTAMLGVAAMKTSIFSSRVAVGTQVDAMAFEGAESALLEAFDELGSEVGMADLVSVLDGGTYSRCVTAANPRKQGACTDQDRLDSRNMVQASARAVLRATRPISGGQVSNSGSTTVLVDYEVGILGESDVVDFNLSNHHAQEALRRGIKAGAEIE